MTEDTRVCSSSLPRPRASASWTPLCDVEQQAKQRSGSLTAVKPLRPPAGWPQRGQHEVRPPRNGPPFPFIILLSDYDPRAARLNLSFSPSLHRSPSSCCSQTQSAHLAPNQTGSAENRQTIVGQRKKWRRERGRGRRSKVQPESHVRGVSVLIPHLSVARVHNWCAYACVFCNVHLSDIWV